MAGQAADHRADPAHPDRWRDQRPWLDAGDARPPARRRGAHGACKPELHRPRLSTVRRAAGVWVGGPGGRARDLPSRAAAVAEPGPRGGEQRADRARALPERARIRRDHSRLARGHLRKPRLRFGHRPRRHRRRRQRARCVASLASEPDQHSDRGPYADRRELCELDRLDRLSRGDLFHRCIRTGDAGLGLPKLRAGGQERIRSVKEYGNVGPATTASAAPRRRVDPSATSTSAARRRLLATPTPTSATAIAPQRWVPGATAAASSRGWWVWRTSAATSGRRLHAATATTGWRLCAGRRNAVREPAH